MGPSNSNFYEIGCGIGNFPLHLCKQVINEDKEIKSYILTDINDSCLDKIPPFIYFLGVEDIFHIYAADDTEMPDLVQKDDSPLLIIANNVLTSSPIDDGSRVISNISKSLTLRKGNGKVMLNYFLPEGSFWKAIKQQAEGEEKKNGALHYKGFEQPVVFHNPNELKKTLNTSGLKIIDTRSIKETRSQGTLEVKGEIVILESK